MMAFLTFCTKCPYMEKIPIHKNKFDNHWHCGKSDDPRMEIVAFETAKQTISKTMVPPPNCPSLLDHYMAYEELKEIMDEDVVAYDTCRIAANLTLPPMR